MPSLRAHLRHAEHHGRLPFHPECPICRDERLAGALPARGALGTRGRALLAAGVLALSSGAPAMALAGAPDQDQEGAAAPGQSADPATDPDLDPGGDSAGLSPISPPAAQGPAPTDSGSDDAAPVEPDPAADAAAPIVDPGDGAEDSLQPEQPPPAAAAPPGETAAPPAATASPTPAPAAPSPTVTPAATAVGSEPSAAVPGLVVAAGLRGEHKMLIERAPDQQAAGATMRSHAASPAPARGAVSVAASPAAGQASASDGRASRGGHVRPGDGAHTVRPGESLWSIADALLGGDAGPARIAREVDRLWRLNRERIATGDPDLLAIGTRLRLR